MQVASREEKLRAVSRVTEHIRNREETEKVGVTRYKVYAIRSRGELINC